MERKQAKNALNSQSQYRIRYLHFIVFFHDAQREVEKYEDYLLEPPFSSGNNGTQLCNGIVQTPMIPCLASRTFIELLSNSYF